MSRSAMHSPEIAQEYASLTVELARSSTTKRLTVILQLDDPTQMGERAPRSTRLEDLNSICESPILRLLKNPTQISTNPNTFI